MLKFMNKKRAVAYLCQLFESEVISSGDAILSPALYQDSRFAVRQSWFRRKTEQSLIAYCLRQLLNTEKCKKENVGKGQVNRWNRLTNNRCARGTNTLSPFH